MTDALGATVRIDLVDLVAHENSLIRAGGLADIAVDAGVSDLECHAVARPC